MSNKAELLKKIKALADRGVDGERESAQTLLARLMEQYGISETDLEKERRETAWFRYSQETERRLLNQIIYMVTGRSGFGCVGSYSGTHYARPLPRAKPSKGGSHMQRAIQNTQAATRRRSRPLRVAGSTLTANVAFAVLKYAALTAAGVLLFRWGQGYALAERGYKAIGGEALLLGLPLFWYLTETTIRDTVRDFRKGGRRK